MKVKTVVMLALLAFLAVSVGAVLYNAFVPPTPAEAVPLERPTGAAAAGAPTPPAAATAAPAALPSRVVAYYFYGTSRCTSCITIEQYSKDAIEQYFAAELKSGKLEFRAINVELPPDQHYIQDYKLTNRSLVLALYKDDQQVRWENQQDVWVLLNTKDRFYDYVKAGVTGFLSEVD